MQVLGLQRRCFTWNRGVGSVEEVEKTKGVGKFFKNRISNVQISNYRGIGTCAIGLVGCLGGGLGLEPIPQFEGPYVTGL